MTFLKFAAVGVSAVVLMSGGSGAFAGTCRETCNASFSACEQAGKVEDQCREAWRQCKNKCDLPPTVQKTSVKQTTAPPTTTSKPKSH